MIDGTYKIQMDVPFGRKDGTITLRTEGDVAFADVDAPVIGKQQLEGSCEGNTFTAQGSGKIKLVGKIDYTIKGEVAGDDIHISIESNKGEFKIDGVRV